tara:strand:- start:15636 stop:16211 length:576 start_codon:yes stop_codon:yes gene_type:complete
MTSIFLYSAQLSILGLISLLIYRVRTLYFVSYPQENEHVNSIINRLIGGDIHVTDQYDIKMDCLKQAQIFCGVQMLDVKRSYGNLNQKNLSWLKEAIGLYLIGAVDFIGKQARCDASTRKELITLALKSNLKLTDETSNQYFSEALYRTLSSEKDLMVRAGAKSAKHWLNDTQIPKDLALSYQLNDWGVFT